MEAETTGGPAGLSSSKRALLERLLRGKAAGNDPRPTIPRRSGEDPSPVSFAQQRLWFIHQLDPQSSAYIIASALRLRGGLVVPVLERALTELVGRHESLRTRFEAVEGTPVQVVDPPPERPPLTFIDLEPLPASRREAEASRLAAAEGAAPFDLARGPLFRAVLARLSVEEHVLLLTMHHIVSDGWSMGILVRELASLYAAFASGLPSPLEALPIQYADFALWQRTRDDGEGISREIDYWRGRLSPLPEALDLPADRPRPAVQTFRGGVEHVVVPTTEAEALRRLGREEGATLYMVLLAALDALLARASGARDIAVGTGVANRTLPELEPVVGFFVNTLVLRVDCGGDPTFRELVCRSREAALGAFSHQEVPFERIVEELQPARDLGKNPLFQVLFELQNAPADSFETAGLSIEEVPTPREAARFDLELHLWETSDGGLDGFLGYNADLFEAGTARALAERFRGIVKAVAERPFTRLSDLCRPDGAERERVIGVWSGARGEHPLASTLIETFDRVVEERSRDVALVHEGGSMSYGQLSVRAKAVARLLAEKGMGLESRVGLAMERSPDFVVAMLGIVGAGAAYVPIDAASPPERTARMLAEAGVSLVVTEGRAAVPSGAWEVVDYRNLDPATTDSAEQRVGREAAWPCPVSSLDRLAYVMFTSGSTGDPKGIEVTHRGVLRLVLGQDYVRFGPGETILQLAPAAFDASTFEIWGALLTGGRLAVAPAGIASADEIARMLERFGVTTLWLTAGLFHVVVEEELATLARVPQVLAGGDVLSPAHVRRLLEAGASCVVNGYGPTESTTFACCHRLAPGDPIEGRVPIGKPIANTRVYVLDAAMEPVPPGMAGEIHLGGAGLARGYAGRPDLTAERFVPDPFGAPGSRLYRTGDVGRWHEEGRLEFLGRRDGQLKLRGFRVEIGEIEAAMASLPGVRSAAATARTARGGTEIVGFVVLDDTVERGATGLRRSLAERLPGYMVPSRLVFIDGIPLTPNGKIDRRALSALDVEDAEPLRSSPSVPVTPTERAVVDVWTDVLGGRPPGLDDDFFLSGGHSLLATRVIARLRTRLGAEVPLKTLFERPTVRGLAAWIDASGGVVVQAGGSTIARARRDRPLPLSFAQQRLWFLDRLSPGLVAYNIPTVLRLEGRLDASALERALGELVRRHEALRTRFTEGPDGPVQVIDDPEALSLPVVDLRGEPDADGEARRRITDEALIPFDLARGSLVRAKLFRLADEDALFLLTLHHIVSDGWSMGVLVREVAALYEAFVSGRPSPLPELSIQYADFAVWQRERLSGDRLDKELGWWRDRLTPLPPPVDLPADRPRPAVESFRGGAVRMAIPAEIARTLRAIAAVEGATLFAALLTGWDALLFRLTGEDDIAVGTGIANRTHLEIEPLIGFFVNTLVLRVDCSGDPSYRELLRRVRDVALGAFAHQDLPFERLVEELQPTRDLARNPIFQIAFALQNMPQDGYEVPGLTIGPFPFDGWTTRFDLEMHLWDGAGGSLEGWLFYSADLFDETTIERTVARYVGLLASAVKRPEERLSRLCAEAPREIETATRVLARGPLLSAPPRPALELFEEQAARRPGAPALVEGDRTLSYGELDEAAARLAAELRRGGVRRESRVAIFADRSIEQVVAVLAAAKAGAPYVPLDPVNPDGRLASMLDRAGADDLLVSRGYAERGAARGRRVIGIEMAWRPREGRAENVTHARGPDDLAYVIFTSGSTGEPQGVEVTQGGLANLVAWHIAAFGLSDGDRTALVAGVGFDASVWELWPALASGACLHIPDEETRLDPAALRDWILARGITSAFLPTPLAMLALALEWPQEGSLRTLLTGGDRLRPLGEARLPFRVVNNYGPTETAVVATSGELDTGASSRAPTIGRPIANARTYVLDARLRPAPIGVAGELFVGGAGVARGYAGAPGLTAARFLPDPWADAAGARMYRTGDRARLLEDGRIEFLGRLDQQVKVRGHRIEPAEIETVIAGHPSVESVAVVPVQAEAETRLIAYVTPRRHSAQGDEWEDEHIGRWRRLYDETYGETPESQDASFNITGWNSSYTGRPIDPEEMREWRDLTVDRILAFGPRRVLEIGCGTGLLLLRLAPRCERYVATDFSSVSLDLVRRALADRRDLAHVELLERRADMFDGFEPASFDTVVINSVVQYFPDADYLERVIEGAMHAVAPGGRVFVGDVRDLRLQRAFAASVALHGESQRELTTRTRSRAEQIVAREEELLVDPRFFGAMARRESRGVWVEALVKRGRADNELTRFRYDAVMHIGAAPEGVKAREVRWTEGGRAALEVLLGSGADVIRVLGIPNARIVADVTAARALEEGTPQAGQLPVLDSRGAMHPDDAAALLAPGWTGTVHLSLEGEDLFDLLLVRSGRPEAAAAPAALLPPPAGKGLLGPFTNVPLRATVAGLLAPTLRAYAAERLPASMVPAAFVVLETLPLTPNGKLDRKALPAPEARQSSPAGVPRSSEEEIACDLFAEVLGVARVGPRESFFELGGHSLLATRLVSRARTALGAEISLRALFEAPTPAGFARAAAAARRMGAEPMPALVRGSDAERRKLSHAQLRLWFLDRLEGRSAAYNVATAMRLTGPLDVGALSRALAELERRHEALRTRITEEPGGPEQRFDAPRGPSLALEDLSGETDPFAEASRRLGIEAETPFELSKGPLWRARLYRITGEEHVLSLVIHHIITDGWSMDLLVGELARLYRAFSEGRESPLPEPAVQYADWAAWHRAWLERGELSRQLGYWRRELLDAPRLDLPTDRPRPPRRGLRGDSIGFEVAGEDASALARLGKSADTTLFHCLFACFHALLARHAASDDIVVGTPCANRSVAEAEGIVGFFANTLAIRSRVQPKSTLRELVTQIREKTLSAYAHQDAPFEALVEALHPVRDLSRNPVFDAMFVLVHAAPTEAAGSELGIEMLAADTGATPFDLSLMMVESEGHVLGSLQYDADLFEEATARRLVHRFEALVHALAEEPDTRLGDIDLRTAAERELDEKVNATDVTRAERCVHDLIEERAAVSPGSVAVMDRDRVLTYADLVGWADRIAETLRRNGVRPERGVGLLASRSAAWVAAMLGIFKSGGVLVPLDASLPRARVETMLRDAGVGVILAETGLGGHGLAVVRIEEQERTEESPAVVDTGASDRRDVRNRAAAGGAPPGSSVRPANAAYVMFTSGSTGAPKGIVVEHRAIAERALGSAKTQRLGPGDRALHFFSTLFDAVFDEVLAPFTVGAALVVHPDPRGETPEGFLDFVREKRVTVANLSVGFLHELADDLALSGRMIPEELRILVTGGESPSGGRVARILEASSGALTVINAYGPTEAVVLATSHDVARVEESRDPIPIGLPLPNTQVHLLDKCLRPVPLGVLGEIHIGGIGLARGYAGRPAETAAAFIPDPFSGRPGSRLYRTGDLARRLPTGALVFVGRHDGQIKIRGYRVELGEIESALQGLEGVREAVVTVRNEGAAASLAAYIVPGEGVSPDPEALRAAMRASLPDYMVPATVTLLTEMPRTLTGKIDRRALPVSVSHSRPGVGIAPRDDLERAIAHIWAATLGGVAAGTDENFFESGGNSLLAVKLITALKREIGAVLPVAAVFQEPTVAGLARLVRGGAPASSPVVPLRQGTSSPAVVCVHEIAGGISEFRDLAALVRSGRPVFGIQGLDGAAPDRIEEAAAAYARAIRSAIPEGSLMLLGWSYGGLVAFEMARLLAEAGRALAPVVLIDSLAPGVDSQESRAPMARAAAALWGDAWAATSTGKSVDVRSMVRAAREAGALPTELGDAEAERWFEGVARRFESLDHYRPAAYPGDVILVRGTESEAVAVGDETLGWREHVTGRLTVEWVPGSHHSIMHGEGARAIAAIVERHIGERDAPAQDPQPMKPWSVSAVDTGAPMPRPNDGE